MAIAYDAGTGRQLASAATSLTYAHTCTGTDRALFVAILLNNTPDDVTSVTYNGVAMTQVATYLANSQYRYYLYVLANPASGSNNVVINTGVARNIFSCANSYTGVDQTNPTEGSPSSTHTNATTSQSRSITTITDNAWVVSTTHAHSTPANTSAGSGTTSRFTGNSLDYAGFVDSGAAVTPAGSKTLNLSSSTSQTLGMIAVAVKPASAGGVTVAPTTQAATFSVPAYSITGNISTTQTPTTQAITASIPAYSVSAGSGTIEIDSVGTKVQVSSGTSVSGSFNNVAGEIILVIVGESVAASSLCTGVTYNGVALTKIAEGRVGTAGRFNTLWAWDTATNGAAPTGSNTLTATFSASVTFPGFVPVSYTGVDLANPIGDTDVYSADTVTSIANTLVTTAANSMFAILGRDQAGNRTYTVTEGDVRFNTDASGYVIADLLVPSAGSKTFTLSDAGSATGRLGLAAELLADAASPNVTVTPATQSATFSVPTYSITGDIVTTVTPATQSATFSTNTIVVTTESLSAINTVLATFSIPSYSLINSGSAVLSPTTQASTFSVPTYTVSVVSYILLTPSTLAATFNLITATVTVELNAVISASPLTATFSIPGIERGGGLWEPIPAIDDADQWSAITRLE